MANPLRNKTKDEAKTKAAIKALVSEMFDQPWIYMPPGGAFGKRGVPDYVCCVPVTITPEMVGQTYGMFLGVEAKRPKKDPTAAQTQQITEIREARGLCGVVRDDEGDIEVMREALKQRFHLGD